MFCYHVRTHIGALAATLGGLDTLVFTGASGARRRGALGGVASGLEHLGIARRRAQRGPPARHQRRRQRMHRTRDPLPTRTS